MSPGVREYVLGERRKLNLPPAPCQRKLCCRAGFAPFAAALLVLLAAFFGTGLAPLRPPGAPGRFIFQHNEIDLALFAVHTRYLHLYTIAETESPSAVFAHDLVALFAELVVVILQRADMHHPL